MADYLPALRFKALTPLFDRVVSLTTREATFKQALLDQAGLAPGQSVLDLGAGTGTLAIEAKQRQPDATVVGLDADEQILELARKKAAQAGLDVQFTQGLATELPYPDRSFDRVLTTLFFHHLTPGDRQTTLTEVVRVLRPDGQLHVGDWGAPADALQAVLSWPVRLLDGNERTRENFTGQLPRLLADAGLANVEVRCDVRTSLGTINLLSASR